MDSGIGGSLKTTPTSLLDRLGQPHPEEKPPVTNQKEHRTKGSNEETCQPMRYWIKHLVDIMSSNSQFQLQVIN